MPGFDATRPGLCPRCNQAACTPTDKPGPHGPDRLDRPHTPQASMGARAGLGMRSSARLAPGSASLLLWLLTGYSVVTAVLVVSFGRLGDMFGRVKMFNLGFAIFTAFSVLLSVTWLTGRPRRGG